MTKRYHNREKVVRSYLYGDKSLRETAKEFGIHYNTLHRWVKWYRVGGVDNLLREERYTSPWNRVPYDVEKEIILIKEKRPNITLAETKAVCEKRGRAISLKGIWNIWKRYGYAGFKKDKLSNRFSDFIPILPETKKGINRAKIFIEQGKINFAARVLNDLPVCPDSSILNEIPDRYLNNRRILEKLSYLFGKIPYSQYRSKIRDLRGKFLAEGYLYSALRAGIKEILVLEWLGKPKEQLTLIKELKKVLKGKKNCSNNSLYFTLLASEFIAHIRLMKIEKAIDNLRRCRRLSRTLSSPSFLTDLATLYSYLGYYKEMGAIIKKVLKMTNRNDKKSFLVLLAFVESSAAHYISSMRILKKMSPFNESIAFFAKAHNYIGMGKIEKAREFAKTGLLKARKMGILGYVSNASLILAEVNAALRENHKAKLLLKKYLELLEEVGMYEAVVSRKIILKMAGIPEDAKKIRTLRLALLLRKAANSGSISDYRKAYQFAYRHELLGVFHRLVFLIPDAVLAMLKRGKGTGLPRAILHLPIFRKEVPVYFVKFLGKLIVYKNQRYLHIKLSPKDTSFLIYLAMSARKHIPLERVYSNFWYRSKNPSRNLAHLLVRVRKTLRLPSHFLYVKEKKLVVECYFTTDYDEYQEHLAQAKALLRAGEWGFAKREFLQAFKLFRGEPFKKMYDDWSDDRRLEVLFSYEEEVKAFVNELFKRGRTEEAERVLTRAERIVPGIDMGQFK